MAMTSSLSRNLALELVRGTEAAALMAGRWMGRGQKESADGAAVDALRQVLNTIEMDGIVVIGEGDKDEAPMLYTGEQVGRGVEPRVDIAVDPVEGTRLLAQGMPNAIVVLAVAERGSLYGWQDVAYMEKIAVGPEAAGVIDINAPVSENLRRVAGAKGAAVSDLTVVILDRPRHEDLIRQVRDAGARMKLIGDGDVAGGLLAAMPGTGIDLLMGVGGSPEAVITACALRCVGGDMQTKLWIRNEDEEKVVKEQGLDVDRVYGLNDLVQSEDTFFVATGITDGELLRGVHYFADGATTHSLVMRERSGTVRYIESSHRLGKLRELANVPYK
jgi:fructose-1,6-bisphosphatase II